MSKVKCENCGAIADYYSKMSCMFVCHYCLLEELLNRADISSDVNPLPYGGIEEKDKDKYEDED